MSGCLLRVPVAEQGASKSTASNFSLGFHEVPSAFTILISKFSLFNDQADTFNNMKMF